MNTLESNQSGSESTRKTGILTKCMKYDYTWYTCTATEAWISKPMYVFNIGLVNGIKRIWVSRIWGVAFLHDPLQVFIQRLVEIDEINELPEEAIIISGYDIYYVKNWQVINVYDAPNARLVKNNNIIIPPGLNSRGYGVYAKKVKSLEKYEDLEDTDAVKAFEFTMYDELNKKNYVKVLNDSIMYPVKLWRPGKLMLTINIQPNE